MKIRTEITLDFNAIEALTYQAFDNHPHHAPGAKPTEHLIINKLRNEGALTLSLVAEDDLGIVGHIAFSPVVIGGVASKWYGLGPISVTPDRQGEGIGGKLINAGLDQLKTLSAEGVVLLGDPEYYGRFGFNAHANLTLDGVPAECFMVHQLCGDESTLPIGEVEYHRAFFE